METRDTQTLSTARAGNTKLVLLAVLLVMALGMGVWVVQKSLSGAAQSSAVEELKTLGATIINGSDGTPSSLILAAPGKDPIDLAKALPLATDLVKLDSLQLSGTAVTDDQLQFVGQMRSLGDLQLSNTPISDAGIRHLTGLSRLTSLYVSGTQVTSNALVDIGKLSSLKVLGIDKTAISGGFSPLAALEDLTLLVAGGLTISEQDADEITTIPNLRRIDLTDATVSPEAVVKLRAKIPDVAGIAADL